MEVEKAGLGRGGIGFYFYFSNNLIIE